MRHNQFASKYLKKQLDIDFLFCKILPIWADSPGKRAWLIDSYILRPSQPKPWLSRTITNKQDLRPRPDLQD